MGMRMVNLADMLGGGSTNQEPELNDRQKLENLMEINRRIAAREARRLAMMERMVVLYDTNREVREYVELRAKMKDEHLLESPVDVIHDLSNCEDEDCPACAEANKVRA